ncbi:MAG TPA: dTDP-4-dehydrorhamnose 3,5-epimerase, partial [Methylococcaceae bacterium]|nr:dTDP-4-dehydrorhamnose 3,5-epimerase [Methylococcaceae bacterium]
AFDDPELDINWCLPKKDLILSEKDRRQPLFADLPECFNMAKNDV